MKRDSVAAKPSASHPIPGHSAAASAGVAAVLAEVQDRLRTLIDDADLQALKTVLGRGEVDARVDAMGQSTIYETACPGVWWSHHTNADGETVAEAIEITPIPDLLTVQDGDLPRGLSALERRRDELLEAAGAPLGDTP